MYGEEEEPLQVFIVHVSTQPEYVEGDYCVIAFFALCLTVLLYVLLPTCQQRRPSPQVLATVEAYPVTEQESADLKV